MYIGQSSIKARYKLPGFPFQWSHIRMHLILPAMIYDTCKVLPNQGSSPEPWCPEFSLDVSHVGRQYLYDRPQLLRLQPSSSRVKPEIHHKSHCQHKLLDYTDTVWPKVSNIQNQSYQAYKINLLLQGLRIYLPGANQEPFLKISLSLRFAGFNADLLS